MDQPRKSKHLYLNYLPEGDCNAGNFEKNSEILIECFFCEFWEGEARGGPLVVGPGTASLSRAANTGREQCSRQRAQHGLKH